MNDVNVFIKDKTDKKHYNVLASSLPNPNPPKTEVAFVATNVKIVEDNTAGNNIETIQNINPTPQQTQQQPTPQQQPTNNKQHAVIAENFGGVGGETTKHWTQDLTILFAPKDYIPTSQMNFTEKINAISRLVIVASLVLAILYQKVSFVFAGLATLFVLYFLHYRETKQQVAMAAAEGFDTNNSDTVQRQKETPFLKKLQENSLGGGVGVVGGGVGGDALFDKNVKTNPFSNVMMNDIHKHPAKKPAPPIDTAETNRNIIKNVKAIIQQNNPSFPDIAEKIFKSRGDDFVLEQSLQPFYTTASSIVPNDQKAFSQFCYGDMISAKEGNPLACVRNLPRFIDGES